MTETPEPPKDPIIPQSITPKAEVAKQAAPPKPPLPPAPAVSKVPPTTSQSPAPPPRQSPPARSALAVFGAIGFLLLFIGLFYVWQQLQNLAGEVDPTHVEALEAQVGSLQQRLARLEQQPAPTAPPPVNLAPLAARVAALEQRPAAPASAPDTTGPLLSKLDALQAQLAKTTAHATRDAQLQAAATALASGTKLGDLPGAPPALARFASVAPPTEAALRLSFPAAAQAAADASRPTLDSSSMAQRMWQRVAGLVTVREGNKVLVGPPATAVLATAGARLDAGDLAGAVATLDGLDSAAAGAIASWRAQAQSLLDARAALAGMARG
jgi:hypothetical protein